MFSPRWFDAVSQGVFAADTTVRRYFPAFVEACRVVCLIRSFQRDRQESPKRTLMLEYTDFAIAAQVFDDVFVESLGDQKGSSIEVREAVRSVSAARNGEPIGAADLAEDLGVSLQVAYRQLRQASAAGSFVR